MNNSGYVGDIMINVDEIKNKEIFILKNPVVQGDNISILFPNYEGETSIIKVYSINGILIKNYEIKQVMNGIISFSTQKMTPGLYFVNIKIKGKTINHKIIIE